MYMSKNRGPPQNSSLQNGETGKFISEGTQLRGTKAQSLVKTVIWSPNRRKTSNS